MTSPAAEIQYWCDSRSTCLHGQILYLCNGQQRSRVGSFIDHVTDLWLELTTDCSTKRRKMHSSRHLIVQNWTELKSLLQQYLLHRQTKFTVVRFVNMLITSVNKCCMSSGRSICLLWQSREIFYDEHWACWTKQSHWSKLFVASSEVWSYDLWRDSNGNAAQLASIICSHPLCQNGGWQWNVTVTESAHLLSDDRWSHPVLTKPQ